jgi:hypothetical protein
MSYLWEFFKPLFGRKPAQAIWLPARLMASDKMACARHFVCSDEQGHKKNSSLSVYNIVCTNL